ncbi:ATP-binding protein [Streptomyces sp. NPDC059009]|uniref:ATP-binding protein n=1 Tax=Streptomyces sp. NPDC059009 TaxID=3346694 RepID=UPI0036A12E7C
MHDEPDLFVGRRTELACLARALEEHRVVTLTGAGGVGKSRLARQSIEAGLPSGAERVCWADLWPLQDDVLLAAAVADACELADHTARLPAQALSDWIGGRRLLLVLDSCEHVVDGCRRLLAELVDGCPRLTVLTTSREPLHLPGERIIRVDPLPVDREAVELFADRAAAAGHPLRGDTDLALARKVCADLEGVPLALELAAAQLRTHDLRESVRRARARLDLTGPPQEWAPAWHSTLRTTVGWSHELCAPEERLTWARLSVLRGRFDGDAATAVCADSPMTPYGARRAVAALVDKSVLTLERDRFRMLDTLREYGQWWLEALGEGPRGADRHADHYLELARLADAQWAGPQQASWYRTLREFHLDVCAALEHLLAHRPDDALELAGLTGFFWVCCGHLHEARAFLGRALEAGSATGPARARALWALGLAHILQGEHEPGLRLAAACRDEAAQADDGEHLLKAAYLYGLTDLLDGRPERALMEAVTALATPDAPRGATLLCRLAHVFALTALGSLTEARREARLLRQECRADGEHWTRSYTDYQLAVIALLEGQHTDATRHARSMLTSKREIGDSFGVALGLDILSAALAGDGKGEDAALAYGAGHRFWQNVGHPRRGTPEIAPLRDQGERTARRLLGDPAYDLAFRRATQAEPEAMLAWAVGGGGAPGTAGAGPEGGGR